MITTSSMGTANTVNTINAAKLALAMAAVTATALNPTANPLFQHSSATLKSSISPIISIVDNLTRETTLREELIGEIRSWNLLDDNWDGEGGSKPSNQSMKEAVSFVTLISNEVMLPNPCY